MFAKRREPPSVVSTRILKTHRLNEVETFRLQGKIRTIDNEIHANYCQISDEIDGVRKNLNRIRKLKNNLGITVARRKLLRDKGVFVVPSPGLGDEGITLRRKDGKKVLVRGKECYDGEIIRKYLDMSLEFSELKVEGDLEEEESSTAESFRGDDETHERKKVFQYRIISPPLRPGSRRNFKDFEEEYHSEVEMDLPPSENYMDSLRKSLYRMRAQTGLPSRGNKRPKQRTERRNPGRPGTSESTTMSLEIDLVDDDNQESIQVSESDVENQVHEPNVDMGRAARGQLSTGTTDTDSKEERKIHYRNDILASNQEIDSKLGKEKRRVKSNTNSLDVIPTVSVVDCDLNRELENDSKTKVRTTSARCASPQMTQVGHQRKESSSENSLRFLQTKLSEDEGVKFPSTHDDTLQNNTVELACSDRDENMKAEEETGSRSIESINNSYTSPCKQHTTRKLSYVQSTNEHRKQQTAFRYPSVRTESFSSIANTSTKSIHRLGISGSERKLSIAQKEFIYDARPDKTLSKGYTTMQMTIGGKMVQLCLPKFSHDDIVERVRAKTAAKLADERTRIHSPKQKEKTSEKKTQKHLT